MANSRTFEVKFVGNTKGLSQSFKELQKDAGILAKGVSSASSIMKTAIAGVSFVGLVRGAQQAVMAASNLSESIAKANTVFSNNQDAIDKWSRTTSRAFGVNRQAALEAAGTYGNLFQAFGVSQDQAYKMSTSLVELAADMASFNNVPIDQALTALRAGLSGEAEPLKRFGVGLNEARLKAEAAAMGLGTFTGTLPPAIRMQAAYSLVLKDTALQQGDVARTSDGLANQMKFLQAGIADAKAGFGELLIPIVLDTVTALNTKLLPALDKILSAFKEEGVGGGIKSFQDQLGSMISGLEGAAKSVYNLTTFIIGMKIAIPTIAAVRVAFDAVTNAEKRAAIQAKITGLTIKSAMISTGIGILVVALGMVIQYLIDAYMTSETFRNKVNAAFGAVIETAKKVFGWIGNIAKALGLVAKTTVEVDAAALAAGRASDKLGNVNKSTLTLGKTVEVTKSAIDSMASSMSGSGAGGGSKAVDAAAEAAKKAIDGFKDSLNSAKDKLADAQNAFKEFASSVAGSITSVINFGSAANAETGTFLENLVAQAAKAAEFGNKVRTLLGMGLSESAISQVLAAGADAGIKIADEIIAGGATVVDQVNTLVSATQTLAEQVGQAGATQFYSAGVAQGQALVQGIVDAIKAAGFTIQGTAADTIAEAAKAGTAAAAPAAGAAKKTAPKKTAPVKKPKVTKAPSSKTLKIPMMAKGGVVTAPTLAMIGEAGPEAVVPLNRSGGVGSTVNITVNAGMGADGAAIGREIVDAIKRYERTSGPVFASA